MSKELKARNPFLALLASVIREVLIDHYSTDIWTAEMRWEDIEE